MTGQKITLTISNLVSVKNAVGDRIRRIRAGKGLTLANVAHELSITPGAYAKIERGETDAPTSRLMQIANILEVHVGVFFDDVEVIQENKNPNYGYASKADVENLSHLVHTLIREVDKLRNEVATLSPKKPKRKR